MHQSSGIVFLGFGRFGQQLHRFLVEGGISVDSAVAFDDYYNGKAIQKVYPFEAFRDDAFKNYEFVLGLGYLRLAERYETMQWLLEHERKLLSYIHPTAVIEPSAKIGQGCFIGACSHIASGAELGNGVHCYSRVNIEHDSYVGDATFLTPNVCIAGGVNIGKRCFCGISSVIFNDITIGNDAMIGGASAVTQDIPDNSSALGNPVRILKNRKLRLT